MESDLGVIEGFLNRIGKRSRHTLAAIHPIKPGLHGSTYEANQRQQMLRYIIQKQKEGFGIYYSLNEGVKAFMQRGYNGKLLATEIIKIHMIGFDIDWITGGVDERIKFEADALALLIETPTLTPPSLVVSTGGGVQALYVFDLPLPVALSNAKIPTEDQAKADVVAQAFRDDFTRLYADMVLTLTAALKPMISAGVCKIDKLSNIDRVFRMPGTVNFPTPAKIEKGATIRRATVIYDKDTDCSFYDLRESTPAVTPEIERKPRAAARKERENLKWTYFEKAKFLCEYIRKHTLIDDNENYTHNLMFPLFGMMNRSEITAEQGRALWLLATESGRATAHGDWKRKWDTRKAANYTSRDLGTIIYFCRQHGCLMPWSAKDYEEQTIQEARIIEKNSLLFPVIISEADQTELTGF